MTTRDELAVRIPRQALVELREQGLSFRKIARRYKVGGDRLREYAREVLPHRLYYRSPSEEELAEVLPRQRFIELRLERVSFREIARRYGIRRDRLRAYGRKVLPHHLYYIRQYSRKTLESAYCTRCSFLPDERNPMMEDGVCLWCRVELAGLNLLWFHESGMATMVLEGMGVGFV